MKTIYKNSYFFLCLCLLNCSTFLSGQSQLTLSNQILTQSTYIARDEIVILPVTSGITTVTDQISLFIDKSMIIPAGYSSSNAPITDINRVLDVSLAVGSTPGSHSVSPMGATTYNIPVIIPPGTMNLIPNLSIDYNSQINEGLLGFGWNLSGLSSISRSGKTIYHNGQVDGINLNNDDWFTLDGNRLMVTSGANGQNDAEYHTEAESFSKTTSNGTIGNGPGWFKVETKDGLTMELGNTSDSRLMPVGQTTVLVWMVSKIYDKHGNYISFEYNNTNGEVYINEIKYTGNDNAGIQPYNTIHFYYDQKQEANSMFYNGGEIQSTVLLRSIEIKCEGSFFKEYSFKYNYNTPNSYLGEVQEQGADYSKLNSLMFCYSDDENSSAYQTTNLPDNNMFKKYLPVDYNGDGKKDLIVFNANLGTGQGGVEDHVWDHWNIYQNNGSNSFNDLGTNTTFPSTFRPSDNYYPVDKSSAGNMTFDFSDLNGDGKEDMLLTTYTGFTTKQINVYPYLSNGNGFSAPANPITCASGSTAFDPVVRYLDFNGDQKLDVFICGIEANLSGTVKVWLNAANNSASYSSAGTTFDFREAFAADINGDGKSELVNVNLPVASGSYTAGNYFFRYSNNQFVFEKNNSPFSYIIPNYTLDQSTGGTCSGSILSLSGDFNGDGKTDFIYCHTEPGLVWEMNLGKGDSYYKTVSMAGMDFQNPFVTDCNIFYFTRDVNADGKTDVLEFITNAENTTLNVFYSTGMSFARETFTIDEVIQKSSHQIDFGDFNGDGTDDLMLFQRTFTGATDPVPKIFYFYKGARSKYLKQAVNGFNTKTEFEYKPLSAGGGIYNQSVVKSYPLNNYKGPLYVVTKVTNPDGIGGSDNTTYSYEDAIIHKQGKGLLCFSKITSINSVSNLKKVDEYSYDPTFYAFIPVKSSAFMNTTNDLLSEDTYVNEVTAVGTNRYYHKVIQLIKNNNVAGYSIINEYQYDNNGNLTFQKVITGNNVEIDIVTNSYTQSGSWLPTKVAASIAVTTRQGETPYIRQVNYTYNAKGQPSVVTFDPGKSKSVVKNYTYDSNTGVLLEDSKSSPSGLPIQSLSFEYDPNARFVIKTTNTLNQISLVTCDPKWGKALTSKSVDGLLTNYVYDGFGSVKRITGPDNITAIYNTNWVNPGDIIPGEDPVDVSNSIYTTTTQRPGSPKVKKFFDQIGRERKSETDGLNNKLYAVKSYTAFGSIATESGIYEIVPTTNYVPVISTYSYDALKRVNNIQRVAGNITNTTNYTYTYTSGNMTTSTSTPDNTISTKTSDPTGLMIAASDNGGTITYQYCSNRQLKSIVLNGTTTNTIEYDEYGRQTKLDEKNSGLTLFNYDAYGQLSSQTDANNKTYQFQYDAFGRMTQKSGPDGVCIYQYVSNGNGLNMLQSVTGPNGISSTYNYDQLRRITQLDESISGQNFVYSYMYDQFSHVKKQTYPGGFAIEKMYDAHGYNNKIVRSDDSQVLWQLDEMNPLGQNIKYTLGNGIQTENTFSDFGLPLQFKAGNVQDLNFDFNPANGNLNSRTDVLKNNTENFIFDNLSRLTNAQVPGQSAIGLTYLPNGNINNKTNIGNYSYHGVKQNAVKEVANNNGLISNAEQTISYTSFNKAELLTLGDNELQITYGPDNARKKIELSFQGNISSARYFSSNYEKTITGSQTTEVNYIQSSNGLVGMYVIENGVGEMFYTYSDHLGSILSVTNSSGAVVAEQNFDAWGNKRNPVDWSYDNLPDNPAWLYRGFTGHEHLPDFALINMNGRMYDPLNGRMLSPDSYVQDNSSTQAFNRYSYVMNNPMKYTDPSGDFLVLAWINGFVNGFTSVGSERFKAGLNEANNRANLDIKISTGLFKTDPNSNNSARGWQLFSRFTWEATQTALGWTIASGRNAQGGVDNVDYYGGATLVNKDKSGKDNWGFTLGSYINSQNLKANPYSDEVFRHEYGHTIQSRMLGPLYLKHVGLPSLVGSVLNYNLGINNHNDEWYETQANRLSLQYFEQHDPDALAPPPVGIEWDYDRRNGNPTTYTFNWYTIPSIILGF